MNLTMQDLFKQTKKEWIESARFAARTLLASKPEITIEDVLMIHPRPNYLHPNITGNVFKSEEFKKLRYEPSRRNISHGRVITVWTLKDSFRQTRDRDYEEPDTY